MSTLVTRVATRVNAKHLQSFVDTNGYQGTTYHLFRKDGKLGLASLSFGTCALCDWHLSLIDDWQKEDPDNYRSCLDVPPEVLMPIEDYLVSQLDTWYIKEQFLDNLHMLFGVGYTEENIQEEVVSYLQENH